MNKAVFTHLLTGKEVVIFKPESIILGLLLGPVKDQPNSPDRTWLLLQGTSPLPIEQTQEEALEIISKASTSTSTTETGE